MDCKTDLEFLDWLIWDKEISESEWLESSEETKKAWFKEFKEVKRCI